VPVGNVLVGNTRRDIKHDDATLTVDVVAIPEPTKLLLPGGVPDVELDGSIILDAFSAVSLSSRKVHTVVNWRG